MEKHNNFQLNFSLEGYGSIQIGLYFQSTQCMSLTSFVMIA